LFTSVTLLTILYILSYN